MRPNLPRWVWALGLVVAITPYFIGLGGSTIWDANEAFYVETPRHMVESGDYVNPVFNAAPRTNKPVLSYWVVAGFYKVFGISVWAERLAIVVGAIGIAVAAGVIGRVVYGARAGVLAALVVLASPRFFLLSRRIFIDVYLCLFMALALMCFVLAEARPDRRARWLRLMYVAIGLGVLTKGPVALAVPALAVLVWLVWTSTNETSTRVRSTLRRIRELHVFEGALIVVAIVAPWYVALYAQHGWGPLKEFFFGENVGRYLETVGYQDRNWFFYLPVLFEDLFPWALLLPAAWIARRWHPVELGPDRDRRRLLVVWVVTWLLFFTPSQTKQDLYVFPIVPALAAILGGLLDRAMGEDRRVVMVVRSSVWIVALLVAAAGATLMWAFGPRWGANPVAGADAIGVVLVVSAVWLVAAALMNRIDRGVAGLGIGMAVVIALLATVSLPAFERYKPVAPMSAGLKPRLSPAAVVAHYRTVLPSMTFYLDRPIREVVDMGDLIRLVKATPEIYVLLRPDEFSELKDRLPDVRMCEVARRPLFDVRAIALRARMPWPDIYLIGANDACR